MKLCEKRVLLSRHFAEACERVFETYDFEAHARKIGSLMTILDDFDDNGIFLKGHGPVHFTDAHLCQIGLVTGAASKTATWKLHEGQCCFYVPLELIFTFFYFLVILVFLFL